MNKINPAMPAPKAGTSLLIPTAASSCLKRTRNVAERALARDEHVLNSNRRVRFAEKVTAVTVLVPIEDEEMKFVTKFVPIRDESPKSTNQGKGFLPVLVPAPSLLNLDLNRAFRLPKSNLSLIERLELERAHQSFRLPKIMC